MSPDASGPRPARQAPLFAGLGYALLLALRAWPLVTRPGSAIVDPVAVGEAGAIWTRIDVDLLMWILAWTAHAVVAKPLEIFQANIFHPSPDALASSEHLLGLLPVSGPIYWLSGNAVLTYNATTLVVVWTAAFTSFVLARAWSGRPVAAFLCGALFALGSDVPLDFLRLHSSALHLYALVLLLAWRVAEAPTTRNVVGLVVAAAVQALSGIYVAFGLAAFMGAALPSLVAHARRHGRSGLAPIGGLAVGALPLVVVAGAYLRVQAAGVLPDPQDSLAAVVRASGTVSGLVARLTSELTPLGLALAGIGAFHRGAPVGTRSCLLAIGATGFVLALGTNAALPAGLPSPYEILMDVVPGFSGMRAPIRFAYATSLALAVLAAFGAAALLDLCERLGAERGLRIARVATITMACLLVAVRAGPWPLPLAPDPRAGLYVGSHRWLARHADPGPVLDLPAQTSAMDGRILLSTGRAMLGSTLHWYPLLNGYSGHPPPAHRERMQLARALPARAPLLALCRETGLRWIVVHHGLLPDGSEGRWERAETELPIRPAARLGRDAIYEVQCPA